MRDATHESLLRAFDNKVLRQFVVFSAELAEVAESVPLDSRIRWATEADKDALIAFGLDARMIDASFKADGRIAVLEDDGSLIARACYWIHDINGGNGLKFCLPADAVIGSDGFVDPRFRGLRYLAALRAFAAREFLAAGYRRVVSVSRLQNTASVRANRHARARPLFRVVILHGPFKFRAIWANDGLSISRRSAGNRKVIAIP